MTPTLQRFHFEFGPELGQHYYDGNLTLQEARGVHRAAGLTFRASVGDIDASKSRERPQGSPTRFRTVGAAGGRAVAAPKPKPKGMASKIRFAKPSLGTALKKKARTGGSPSAA